VVIVVPTLDVVCGETDIAVLDQLDVTANVV
jgi:hypothetical protein